MSQPILEQTNFIALGAWNPAIIQPHWLKKHFPKLVEDNCKIDIVSAGSSSSIRMNYEKVIIDPNNGRLVVVPKAFNVETMEYIAKLVKGMYGLLEHTL